MNVFISPHLDDAALSCGGLVRRLTAKGENVMVLTLVTADPPPNLPLSWLSKRNHMAWNLGDAPFAARRLEDEAAWRLLGAQYKHLGLLDAMYRGDASGASLYKKNTVRVPVHPEDGKRFEPEVCQALQNASPIGESQSMCLFCPLTAGDHIDHIIVRHAVEKLWLPQDIVYYEDYPYAVKPYAIRASFGMNSSLSGWAFKTVELTTEEVEARIAAVACYASQLPGLFPSTILRYKEIVQARLPGLGRYLAVQPDPERSRQRMAYAIKDYIARTGGERYWFRTPESAMRLDQLIERD